MGSRFSRWVHERQKLKSSSKSQKSALRIHSSASQTYTSPNSKKSRTSASVTTKSIFRKGKRRNIPEADTLEDLKLDDRPIVEADSEEVKVEALKTEGRASADKNSEGCTSTLVTTSPARGGRRFDRVRSFFSSIFRKGKSRNKGEEEEALETQSEESKKNKVTGTGSQNKSVSIKTIFSARKRAKTEKKKNGEGEEEESKELPLLSQISSRSLSFSIVSARTQDADLKSAAAGTSTTTTATTKWPSSSESQSLKGDLDEALENWDPELRKTALEETSKEEREFLKAYFSKTSVRKRRRRKRK